MAQRYGLLPSEVIARATTFDLTAMDVTVRWENQQRTIRETGETPSPEYSVDELQSILDKSRSKK